MTGVSIGDFTIHVWNVLLWGLLATTTLTAILYGSQGLGLSRLSLPFLVGTWFTSNRDRAVVLGAVLYTIGGWLFALGYLLVFLNLRLATWWLGALLGTLHGLFLLVVILPILPHIHPRVASEYDGPSGQRRLEPPGFMGLNYGRRTPITTLIGHIAYGLLLGIFYHLHYR